MNKTLLWITIYVLVFVWSAIKPHDFMTWFLEVAPAIIGGGVMLATRNTFPLSPVTTVLILIHCIILLVGGHNTYAEVPHFDWLAEVFGWQRNNYDKLGHFFRGLRRWSLPEKFS